MKSFSRILIFFVITVKLVFSQVAPVVIPPPGDDINTNPDPRCSIGKCDTVRVQAKRISKSDITFDGKLDENFWKLNNKLKPTTASNKPLTNEVYFDAVWDQSYFYLGIKVYDNELVGSNWGGFKYGQYPGATGTNIYKDPETGESAFPPPFDDVMEVYITNSNKPIRTKTDILRLAKPISYTDIWSERTPIYLPDKIDSSYYALVSTFTGGYTMEFKINFDEFEFLDTSVVLNGPYYGKRFKMDLTNHDKDLNQNPNGSQKSNWSNFCANNNFTSNEYYGVVELIDRFENEDADTSSMTSIIGATFLCNPSDAIYKLKTKSKVPYVWEISSGGFFPDNLINTSPGFDLDSIYIDPLWSKTQIDSAKKANTIAYYPKTGYVSTVNWVERGTFTLSAKPIASCPLEGNPVSIQIRIGGIVPNINGADIVCPGRQNLYYYLSNTFAGYNYFWSVVGASMVKDTSIYSGIISWGDNLDAKYLIAATPTDENGCKGGTNIFNIILNPLLKATNSIFGDSVLCSDFSSNIPFRTKFQDGLKYTWIAEGGEVTSQTGINNALISFTNKESFVYYVLRDSTPTYVCEGISKKKKVLVNYPPESPEQIYLFQITTNYENDNLIELKWYLNNRYTFDSLRVLRSVNGSPFDDLKRVPRLNTGVKDLVEDTRTNTYQYYLANTLKCNYGVVSPKAGIMNLTAVRQENTDNIKLSWSPYNYWLKGLKHYAVYEKIDNGDTNLLAYTNNTEFYCFKKGFEHEYRILAIANEGFTITPVLTSWSNKAFLTFENPVVAVNNVITPNGDQKNEYFTIENLKPYPQKRVQIFNRYGSLIYESENYNNDWNGGNLSEGIYFYLIEYGRNSLSQKLNGYIQILK